MRGKIIFTHLEKTKQQERERDEYSGPKFDPGFLDIQFCYPGSGTPSYFCASFSFLSWCSAKSRMFKVPFECSAKPACFVRQFCVCCVWIQLICSSLRQTCVCFCKKLFDMKKSLLEINRFLKTLTAVIFTLLYLKVG